MQLHIAGLGGRADALIMVVHRHAKRAFGLVLADHILVQHGLHLAGQRDIGVLGGGVHGRYDIIGNDVMAEHHAFIADEYVGTGHQTAHLILGFSAEAASVQPARGRIILGHCSPQAFFLRG